MLRTIRVPAAATIVVAIAMLVAASRPLVAQTPALRAEPLTDTGRVSLRRAAEADPRRTPCANERACAALPADFPAEIRDSIPLVHFRAARSSRLPRRDEYARRTWLIAVRKRAPGLKPGALFHAAGFQSTG
jgi:hypothetical protein